MAVDAPDTTWTEAVRVTPVERKDGALKEDEDRRKEEKERGRSQ